MKLLSYERDWDQTGEEEGLPGHAGALATPFADDGNHPEIFLKNNKFRFFQNFIFFQKFEKLKFAFFRIFRDPSDEVKAWLQRVHETTWQCMGDPNQKNRICGEILDFFPIFPNDLRVPQIWLQGDRAFLIPSTMPEVFDLWEKHIASLSLPFEIF